MDFILTSPHDNICSRATIHIDGLGFFQKPNSHLKAEIVRCESSDWADVSSIERIV
jgi:hypothetical protein